MNWPYDAPLALDVAPAFRGTTIVVVRSPGKGGRQVTWGVATDGRFLARSVYGLGAAAGRALLANGLQVGAGANPLGTDPAWRSAERPAVRSLSTSPVYCRISSTTRVGLTSG